MSCTAIVILNWNGRTFLEQFIPSVIKYTDLSVCTRLIVADNGSTDDSLSYLQTHFPSVELLSLPHNYGFAQGYNIALSQIEADYFVLLNSDVEVSPHWLEPLISQLDRFADVAVCMPKIRAYHHRGYFEYAGASGGFIDRFGYPFCRGRILNIIEKDDSQYNDSCEIFWASGACMIVRSSLFKELGGFDSDFWAHMEEIDLCWRLKNIGYKITVEPKSVVYHIGGGTLPNENPHKLFLNYRNNLLMLYKNLSSQTLFGTIVIRMLLDCFSAFIYLLQGKFSNFSSVFKAHIDFYKQLASLKEKRKIIGSCNINHAQMFNKSILWSFFIHHKKKFSQLNF